MIHLNFTKFCVLENLELYGDRSDDVHMILCRKGCGLQWSKVMEDQSFSPIAVPVSIVASSVQISVALVSWLVWAGITVCIKMSSVVVIGKVCLVVQCILCGYTIMFVIFFTLFLQGVLCGDCTNQTGFSALLNNCMYCPYTNLVFVPVLSESFNLVGSRRLSCRVTTLFVF